MTQADDTIPHQATPTEQRVSTLERDVADLKLAVLGSPGLRMIGLVDMMPRLRDEVEALKDDVQQVRDALATGLREIKDDIRDSQAEFKKDLGTLRDNRSYWVKVLGQVAPILTAIAAVIGAVAGVAALLAAGG